MKSGESRLEFEHALEVAVASPVSEVLLSAKDTSTLWPEECAAHPSILEQVTKHASDVTCIEEVIDALPSPTTSVEIAMIYGDVTEDQATRLYTTLGDLLDDRDYSRLVLYLPITLLPHASWAPQNEKLQAATERFKESYLNTWKELLTVQDVRANFVDGDVLENEFRTGDLPRVVKAAHLIPQLIGHGLLTEDEVTYIMNSSSDPILHDSIKEALETTTSEEALPATSEHFISERRQLWLDQKEQEQTIHDAAQHVASAILDDTLPAQMVTDALAAQGDTTPQIIIEGIYNAVTTAVHDENLAKATALYGKHAPLLRSLYETGSPLTRDNVVSTYRKLYRLGIVYPATLDELGIDLPVLAGPFSENLSALSTDIAALKNIAITIENHDELKQFLYPIIAVGGSRLKGYGGVNSDVDTSVFIRPGTPRSQQEHIRELLDVVFMNGDTTYEPTEFWLGENTNGLFVHDFADPDIHMADSYWTHTLFNTAWVGNGETQVELFKKLLPAYFYESDEQIVGQNKRQLYLERIEQDTLQYRLLHKGYKRHYPLHNGIDDNTVFWDPGYRLLATKLFVRNVFLPKI